MNRAFPCLAYVAAVLALAEPVHADAPVLLQRRGPATLRTTATVEKTSVVLPFANLLKLIIEVRGDASLEVQAPENWTKSPWRVQVEPPARKDAKEPGLWSQTLLLEPLAPGESSLVLEPLKVRERNGAWQTVAWNPVAVRVISKLTQPDLKSARDITAIEQLPAPLAPDRRGMVILACVIGSILVVGLTWLLWRRRSGTGPGMALETRTLAALERLQALRLPEVGKHERFGTLLTGLLRRYLEKKYRLPARRQTTGEFLATLPHYPHLATQLTAFQSLLQRCDLLKFAPVTSTVEECHYLAEQVRQFISQHQSTGAS